MFDTISTNDLYGGPESGSQGLGNQNFKHLFPGADDARLNPDGTYTVIKYGQGGDGGYDFRAIGQIGPDGTPQVGEFKREDIAGTGQALAEFGLGAAGLFTGLGAIGQGPLAGLFGAAAPVAGAVAPASGAVGGTGLVAGTGGAGLAAGTGGTGLAGAGGIGAGIGSTIPAGSAIGGLGAAGIGAAGIGAAGVAGAAGGGGGLLGSAANYLGVSPGTLLSGAGSLANAGLGVYATGKAADAQQDAAREANALGKYMYDQSRADYAPWRETGSWALGQSKNLLQNPDQIALDPSYQFEFKQGQNAFDNSGAARGMRLSGAQAKGLTRYGQDFAGTQLDRRLNRYNALSGSGLTATGGTTQAGTNYANQAGQNITGAGNAAASGYIGGANAIAGGVNNFLRNWQESEILKRIGG